MIIYIIKNALIQCIPKFAMILFIYIIYLKLMLTCLSFTITTTNQLAVFHQAWKCQYEGEKDNIYW